MSLAGPITLDAPWAGTHYEPALPLDIASVEERIVGHLRMMAVEFGGALSQVAINHFPADPEQYRLTHPVGEVLVIFGDSHPTPEPMTVDEVMQEDTLEWHIGVLARDLGWAYGGPQSGPSPGAYATLEALKLALVGFQLPGFTKMKMVKRGHFVKQHAGVFHYEARYSHRTVVIQTDPDVAYPTANRIRFLEEGGQTTQAVPAADFTFDPDGVITLPFPNVSLVSVAAGGALYVPGTDYVLDAVNGVITLVPGGSLQPGDTVAVSFSYSDVVTAISGGGSAPTAPTN